MPKKMETKDLPSLDINGIGQVTRGMELFHPLFGNGVVEEIFEFIVSGEYSIGINFQKHGYKALSPQYAKLSIPEPTKKSFWVKLIGRGKNA